MKKIIPPTAAVLLTALILLTIRVKVVRPMILADRFINGSGVIEAVLLAVYAGFITWKMLNPSESSLWRLRIWTFFSIVFFLQFVLGVFISDVFLMSGKLHVPVPMVILAGPIYRGEGFFMPVLFFSTILLVGPAWCSHLCYIGSWDALASASRRIPKGTVRYRFISRTGIIVIIIFAAFFLRLAGVKPVIAASFAIAFGLAGVVVMIVFSRRKGLMVHCLTWCPIGLLATAAGRISPFRIKFNDSCTSCGACSASCRYDSLKPDDIRQKRPDLACTLCGDCIGACSRNSLQYSFASLQGDRVRAFFITLIVVVHSVFLGLARI